MTLWRFTAQPVRRVAVLLLGGALLAGCGGADPAPARLPKVTAGAAGTAAPATATADTPAGAAAFARWFYAQVTAAFAARDPGPIRQLSLPSCALCQRYITSVSLLATRNEHTTPVLFRIRFAESPVDTDAATARVDVQYDAPASSRYDARGRLLLSERPISRANHTVLLRRVRGGWKVQAIT